MKIYQILLWVLAIFAVQIFSAQAQTQVGLQVKIKAHDKVVKVITVVNCEEDVAKGSEIKSVYTKTNKTVITTVTDTHIADGKEKIKVEKAISIPIYPNSDGTANVRIDDKYPSILHVNYWLNDYTIVKAGTKADEIIRVYDCSKNITEVTNSITLTSDKTYNLWQIQTTDFVAASSTNWYKSADSVIKVYDTKGNIAYYLVNRYDSKADYQIKLENRGTFSASKKILEIGPITIPIKYRFQKTKGTLTVGLGIFRSPITIKSKLIMVITNLPNLETKIKNDCRRISSIMKAVLHSRTASLILDCCQCIFSPYPLDQVQAITVFCHRQIRERITRACLSTACLTYNPNQTVLDA